MDFNELKKKYSPQSGMVRQEQPQAPPVPEPVVEPMPAPVVEPMPEPVFAPTREKVLEPEGHGMPTLEREETVTPPERVRLPQDDELPTDLSGCFGGRDSEVLPQNPRPRSTHRFSMPGIGSIRDRLAVWPWVDIIMILLTIAGVVWVIVNFDAVTMIIAVGIGKLLQSLIGLIMIVGAIVLAVVILSRRGRRFW